MKQSALLFLLLFTSLLAVAQDPIPFRGANGKWGFKDGKGQTLVAPKYDFKPGAFEEGAAIVRNAGLKGHGFVDRTGKEIAAPQYAVAYPFVNGLARVCIDARDIFGTGGKWGFIDKTGKVVIPLVYTQITGDFEGDSYVFVTIAEKRRLLIDKRGKEVSYPGIDEVAGTFYRTAYSPAKKEGKWGLIDQKGSTILPFEYESVSWETEGLIPVKKEGKWGYTDIKGQWVITPQFDFPGSFQKGYSVQRKEGKKGCIDKKGKTTLPFIYDDIVPAGVASPLVRIYNQIDGKRLLGLAHPLTGKVLAPIQYNQIYDFYNGVAQTTVGAKYGFIDSTGREIVPPIYDYVPIFFSGGLSYFKLDNKYGFIDRTGKVVVQPVYEMAFNFANGLAAVKQNGRWGYIDKKGTVVIPLQYAIAGDFEGGVASVTDAAGTMVAINSKGIVVKE